MARTLPRPVRLLEGPRNVRASVRGRSVDGPARGACPHRSVNVSPAAASRALRQRDAAHGALCRRGL